MAERLRICCGPTGHPILAPSTSVAVCQRVLAKAARTTSGRQLADALEQVLELSGCKLLIMTDGMKLPGEEAHGHEESLTQHEWSVYPASDTCVCKVRAEPHPETQCTGCPLFLAEYVGGASTTHPSRLFSSYFSSC